MFIFTVEVYAAGMLMDIQYFTSECVAQAFADYKQDEGYKVRIVETV